MSVIRQKRRARFTIVDNVSVTDSRLSLRAKGLHLVLLSKPDDWEFSSDRLALECVEGRDAIRAAMRELKAAGYVQEVREQSGGGHWTTVIEVSEVPADEVPVSPSGRAGVVVRPKTAFQPSVDRSSVEPSVGESGDEREDGTTKTDTKKNPSRAVRRDVNRAERPTRKLRAVQDTGDGLEAAGRLEEDVPEEPVAPPPRPSRGWTTTTLVEEFAFLALAADTVPAAARDTNKGALGKTLKKWQREGTATPDQIHQAMETFFVSPATRLQGESTLWLAFVNHYSTIAQQGQAPSMSDPDYYKDKVSVKHSLAAWAANR